MIRRLSFVLAGLVAVGGVALVVEKRNVLWFALQSCRVMSGALGSPFPCTQVVEQDGRPFAIMRPPGAKTHLILSPLRNVVGVEDAALKTPDGAVYFADAWNARARIANAFKGALPLDAFGVAINSPLARSQDHLHIHIDCLRPEAHAALQAGSLRATSTWSPAPFALRGNPTLVMRLAAEGANPFAQMRALPAHLRETSLAILPGQGDDLILFAFADPARGSEELLDHSCQIASAPDARAALPGRMSQ